MYDKLSTEVCTKILSNITATAPGFVKEISHRTAKGGMNIRVYECDDIEYIVYSDAKDVKIINITGEGVDWSDTKGDYFGLNSPEAQAPELPSTGQPVDPNLAAAQQMANQMLGGSVPLPQTTPTHTIPSNTLNIPNITAPLLQFAVDFAIANPGCILNEFDASVRASLNEASVHQTSAWIVQSFYSEEHAPGVFDYMVTLSPHNASDKTIANHVELDLMIDSNFQVKDCTVCVN